MNETERTQNGPDSDLLRTFVAVADCRNVTHAAQRLGRTQSAISVQIGKLEGVLGVKLFQRVSRGMALTPEGDRLLTQARPVLRAIDQLGGLFRDELSGTVRVGIPDDYGGTVLERILAEFAGRHPRVDVFVQCGFSATFPAAVRRGMLDLAVYAADSPTEPGMVLRTEQTVWAANEHWTRVPDEPVPVALFDRACWWRDAAVAALEARGLPYRVALSSESFSGVKAAISAGLAVGMLSASTVEPPMRILAEPEGFPLLPPSTLALLRAPGDPTPTVVAMENAIRVGFSAPRGHAIPSQ